MSNKTLVPGQLQGYLLQVRHMLYELICVDSRVVSVEALDDVAVQVGNKVVASQIKSVTSSNNPITDHSVVFWKTLYNWCIYLEKGSLPSNSILRFVVVANNAITPGGIIESFVNAHTVEDARKALQEAKHILGVAQTSLTIDDKTAKTYSDYTKYLFDDTKVEVVCNIIKSLEIEIHNGTYDEDLLEKFSSQLIPKEYIDILRINMLGWVTEKVHSFTKNGQPAYVTAKEYRDELNAQIKACNVNTFFRVISKEPTKAETTVEIEKLDTYIKQLNLIEADESELLKAASDFLRVKTEKIEWANRGIVIAESFDDYHDALCRTWGDLRDLKTLEHTNPLACGKAVYAQCKIDSRKQKLQGVETPSFFGSGSLHGLANEPANSPRIGWHPRFKELLGQVKQ